MTTPESPTEVNLDDKEPFLLLFNTDDGLVCMMNHHEFATPAHWGIVIADMIKHLVNAYTHDGLSHRHVEEEIKTMLFTELNHPTAKATLVTA